MSDKILSKLIEISNIIEGVSIVPKLVDHVALIKALLHVLL